jgi:hypothetical protein
MYKYCTVSMGTGHTVYIDSWGSQFKSAAATQTRWGDFAWLSYAPRLNYPWVRAVGPMLAYSVGPNPIC